MCALERHAAKQIEEVLERIVGDLRAREGTRIASLPSETRFGNGGQELGAELNERRMRLGETICGKRREAEGR